MIYTSHLCYSRLSEFPLQSLPVLPRPLGTNPENPERMMINAQEPQAQNSHARGHSR